MSLCIKVPRVSAKHHCAQTQGGYFPPKLLAPHCLGALAAVCTVFVFFGMTRVSFTIYFYMSELLSCYGFLQRKLKTHTRSHILDMPARGGKRLSCSQGSINVLYSQSPMLSLSTCMHLYVGKQLQSFTMGGFYIHNVPQRSTRVQLKLRTFWNSFLFPFYQRCFHPRPCAVHNMPISICSTLRF